MTGADEIWVNLSPGGKEGELLRLALGDEAGIFHWDTRPGELTKNYGKWPWK